MSESLPVHVHEESYSDIGQFASATGWELDFRQLDAGNLDARVSVVAGQGLKVIKFQLNLGFHQVGRPPTGALTFGVLDQGVEEISWCSESMPGGAMANFNMKNGFECVSGEGFTAYGISFETRWLEQRAEAMGISDSIELLARSRVIWHSSRTQFLASTLARLFAQLELQGEEALSSFARFINHEIGECVLQELKENELPEFKELPIHQEQVMERALAILESKEHLPISVAALSEKALTTSSTLYRLFQDRFGLSPKAYIRVRCLSAVRDELANSTADVSITKVANDWGFWHMGQFARDFRAQFGHLPSETVRQSS